MKLSCLQENLAKGLGIVGRAVSTRSTLPVLGNVLMSTDTGRLPPQFFPVAVRIAADQHEHQETVSRARVIEGHGRATAPGHHHGY